MKSLLVQCSGRRKRRESGRRRSVCCGKGKRRESEEEISSDPSLDRLGDDVLIEILHRLPTAKSVVGFKLVSKRWCSLISTPRFVTKFITHSVNINKPSPFDAMKQFATDTSVFVYSQYPRPGKHPFFIQTGKQDPTFKSIARTFTFEFLPVVGKFVSVLASCNDLLLCRAERKGCSPDYYICNPYTKQWLLLPPADPTAKHFGLVYEPNYEAWVQGINECRFRVVSIVESWNHVELSLQMHLQIYCSETMQWNYHVPLDYKHMVGSNIVAYAGTLYWCNLMNAVVAYDPFFINETVIIHGSYSQGFNIGNGNRSVSISLGICRGHLRVMKLVNFQPLGDGDDVNHLTVWEVCTNTRRLNVKHGTLLVPQPETGGFLRQPIYDFNIDSKQVIVSEGPKTLAFHPNREDLVYLMVGHHIITCEIASGKLEGLPDKIPFRIRFSGEVFTIVLPWFPTPVPVVPENS